MQKKINRVILRLSNRQSEVVIPLVRLRRQLKAALVLLWPSRRVTIRRFDIVLVDLATIKRVHGKFFNDPTPTDVITFPYGEILVCPAVARTSAPQHGLAVADEVLLYGLHGLLHLFGFNDRISADAKRMKLKQEKLLQRVRSR